MNFVRTSVVGIDTVIQSVQTELYNSLVSQWVNNIDGYGRVYKNINGDGDVIPEFYVGKGEYKEAYYNDDKACTFMFIETDNHVSEDQFVYSNEVKCVFMVNLDKVYQNTTERLDEFARRDVISILREASYEQFEITGIEKGINNVFSGFETKGIKFSDIHPYHCFSVKLNLSYYITDKCV